MTLPLISVVMPVYNYGEYLRAAVESVVRQGRPDVELVIVDDGSTDSTPDIIQQLLSEYSPAVSAIHQDNSGPGAARNNGAKRAAGKYLLFLDADDCLLPGAFEKFHSGLKSNCEAGLVYGGYLSRRVDGSVSNRPAKVENTDPVENFIEFARETLCVCNGGAILVSRTVFDDGGYPETIRTREDYVFFARAFAKFPAVSVIDPVVEIQKHTDSLRNNKDALVSAMDAFEPLLFDRKSLPDDCFRYRDELCADWDLVVSRALYQHGDFVLSRQRYVRGIRRYPIRLFRLGYLSKYLKSFIK